MVDAATTSPDEVLLLQLLEQAQDSVDSNTSDQQLESLLKCKPKKKGGGGGGGVDFNIEILIAL